MRDNDSRVTYADKLRYNAALLRIKSPGGGSSCPIGIFDDEIDDAVPPAELLSNEQ